MDTQDETQGGNLHDAGNDPATLEKLSRLAHALNDTAVKFATEEGLSAFHVIDAMAKTLVATAASFSGDGNEPTAMRAAVVLASGYADHLCAFIETLRPEAAE